MSDQNEITATLVKSDDDEGFITAFVVRSSQELSGEEFLFEIENYLEEARKAHRERGIGPSH